LDYPNQTNAQWMRDRAIIKTNFAISANLHRCTDHLNDNMMPPPELMNVHMQH
jgi:hypothetical protein